MPLTPITYWPSVTPTTVCFTTSPTVRLKRVMSGVMMAPTMKPPATMVVAVASDMGSPAGSTASSSPRLCCESSRPTVTIARSRNAGTVMLATHAIPRKPMMQTNVTIRPPTSAHAHSGRPPTAADRLEANTPFWTPNHPMRLVAMTRPMSADPFRPNPVHLVSSDVESPCLTPAMPTKIVTSSSRTEPRVRASTACQNDNPKPSVAPMRNWEIVDSCPKRCTATIGQE